MTVGELLETMQSDFREKLTIAIDNVYLKDTVNVFYNNELRILTE